MITILVICSMNSAFARNRFFEERYRGWLWFEDIEVQEEDKETKKRFTHELIRKEMICEI